MKKVIGFICLIVIVWSFITVTTAAKRDENGIFQIEATAYYDVNKYGHGATGEKLVEGLTIAGKKEWLGYSAILWDSNMKCLGIYQITDTGYGQSAGYGHSQIIKGRPVGTIENGSCIDIYFDSYSDCVAWGRRIVYMQLIKAVG